MANFDTLAGQGRERFLTYDAERLCSRLGLVPEDGMVSLRLTGEDWRLRLSDGVITAPDGSEAGSDVMLILYDLLCHSSEALMTGGRLYPPAALPGAGQSTPRPERLFAPYTALFAADPEGLRRACTALGGEPFSVGDAAFRFTVFPPLPLVLQFREGDEEFPPQLRFLWDELTLRYFCFETLWYVMGRLLWRIADEMGAAVNSTI